MIIRLICLLLLLLIGSCADKAKEVSETNKNNDTDSSGSSDETNISDNHSNSKTVFVNVTNYVRDFSLSLGEESLQVTGPGQYTFESKLTTSDNVGINISSSMFQECNADDGEVLEEEIIFNLQCRPIFYFTDDDGVHHQELWRSNGTPSGTFIVKDINPLGDSKPYGMAEVGEKLVFFAAATNSIVTIFSPFLSPNYQLWASDGSQEGTTELTQLESILSLSNEKIPVVNGKAVFIGINKNGASQFWISNGTSEGTRAIKDIAEGVVHTFRRTLKVDNKLYFDLNDRTNGDELWVSDGTSDGTYMVKDINTAESSSSPIMLAGVDELLFFSATDGASRNLWVTNGVETSTIKVKDLDGDLFTRADYVFRDDGMFYFSTDGSVGEELWKTNGTPEGTKKVEDVAASEAIAYEDKFVFVGTNESHGSELWISDGTSDGTYMMDDISIGSASSEPQDLIVEGGKVYFTAISNEVVGRELYRTEGSAETTALVKDIGPTGGSDISMLAGDGGWLYFFSDNDEDKFDMWKTDGYREHTTMFDLNHSGFSSAGRMIGNKGGYVLFSANDGNSGFEPWLLELESESIQLAKDINTVGSASSSPSNLTPIGSKMFFTADNGKQGRELWVTEGEMGNTHMVKDISVGESSSSLRNFQEYGGRLLFVVSKNDTKELWISDGSSNGTVMLASVTDDSARPSIRKPVVLKGKAYFLLKNSTSTELWVTDGEVGGTKIVQEVDFLDLIYDEVTYFTGSEKYLYFISSPRLYGAKIYKSDGTAGGVTLVAHFDPNCALDCPSISHVLPVGNLVYFRSENSTAGIELWRTDGTADGTFMIEDLNNGVVSSVPVPLIGLGNELYFTADDGSTGNELWKTSGTRGDMILIEDINPNGSSNIKSIIKQGDYIYYFASSGTGNSIWRNSASVGSAEEFDVVDLFWSHKLAYSSERLFFVGKDEVRGTELWSARGGQYSASIVKDIFVFDFEYDQSRKYRRPGDPVAFNGKVYFSADDGVHGRELWYSDGSEPGTRMLRNINKLD